MTCVSCFLQDSAVKFSRSHARVTLFHISHNLKITFIACCLLQLEGRLKKKEPEEQKIKEEVDEKVQVITYLIIHQIFSLVRDWFKLITSPNIIPQLILGNIQEYSPIFKTAPVVKSI